jgi:hypothetical protein
MSNEPTTAPEVGQIWRAQGYDDRCIIQVRTNWLEYQLPGGVCRMPWRKTWDDWVRRTGAVLVWKAGDNG